jgi:phosphoserine phosphatase
MAALVVCSRAAAAAAAAFMMGEDFYKFGRSRPERTDFLAMASAEKVNSASRQIYLTFPADSTFKDEDVSEYFR